MAQAKVFERTISQPRKVKRVQLELTEGEADFLLATMASIAGHPRNSPRKYAERIRNALTAATGLDYSRADAYRLKTPTSAIYFRDYADPDGGRR